MFCSPEKRGTCRHLLPETQHSPWHTEELSQWWPLLLVSLTVGLLISLRCAGVKSLCSTIHRNKNKLQEMAQQGSKQSFRTNENYLNYQVLSKAFLFLESVCSSLSKGFVLGDSHILCAYIVLTFQIHYSALTARIIYGH